MRGLFNIDGPVMSTLGKLCDLLWLNILTIICCIPIITAGASITSLYYMTMKIVKNEEGYLTKSFFKAFKENFKQSTILWVMMLVVIGIFWADYRIFTYAAIEFPKALIVVFYMLILIFILTAMYIFPLQARFVNTCKGTIKNAFLLCITQLPKTILMVIIQVLPIVLFLFFPIILPIIVMFGFSLPAFLSSYVLVSIFKLLEARQLEREEEGTQTEDEETDSIEENNMRMNTIEKEEK